MIELPYELISNFLPKLNSFPLKTSIPIDMNRSIGDSKIHKYVIYVTKSQFFDYVNANSAYMINC